MSPSESEPHGGLTIRAPRARIDVTDAFFRALPGGAVYGQFAAKLPPGAYTVVAQRGGDRASRTVLVRAGHDTSVDLDPSAGAKGGGPSDQLRESVSALTTPVRMPRGTGAVVVALAGEGDLPTLIDSEGTDVIAVTSPDGVAGRRFHVKPGAYTLRWSFDEPIEQSVWVAPRHQTVVVSSSGASGPDLSATTMYFAPLAEPFDIGSDSAIEVDRAVTALWSGAAARLGSEDWLDADSAPFARLAAALLIATVAPGDIKGELRKRIGSAATDLRRLLGDMPDVLALRTLPSLRSRAVSVQSPPVFNAAAVLLINADGRESSVIPEDSPLERATGTRLVSQPWFLWKSAGAIRYKVVKQRVDDVVIHSQLNQHGIIAHPKLPLPPSRLKHLGDVAAFDFDDDAGGRGLGSPAIDMGRISVTKVVREVVVPKPTRTVALPPAAAVDRVRIIIEDVASRIELSNSETAEHLGPAEVAARAGMPVRLAQRCIEELYS